MKAAMDIGEPPYSGHEDTSDTGGRIVYGLGIYFVFLLFVFLLYYTSYICKRSMDSGLSPPTTTRYGTTSYGSNDYHVIRLPQGLCDDYLSTFPTFLYSEAVMANMGDTRSHTDISTADNCGSGCSICLADYKPSELIRLMPECSHLFHLNCIDTWLKVHPTCPVCRTLFGLSS